MLTKFTMEGYLQITRGLILNSDDKKQVLETGQTPRQF